MKPIIVDMKEMSDSTEVYESRPNRFLVYTIYVLLFILVAAFVWMGLSKMEIVVKSEGMFRRDGEVYEIGSGITGRVKECLVENGQRVNKGDILFLVENETLNASLQTYQDRMEEIRQRVQILEAYQKSLDGDASVLDTMQENPYYEEIINRKKLLEQNQKAGSGEQKGQLNAYQNNISQNTASIQQFQTKIQKLQQVKANVYSRTNEFRNEDSYYRSMVDSYISNYNLTAGRYDEQIKECQNQADASEMEEKAASLQREKEDALTTLEFQQISSVEQLIEAASSNLDSLQASLTAAQAEINSVQSSHSSSVEVIQVLTEKGQIASEISVCEKEASECESYLKNYQIQGKNCNVLAETSGYFYFGQELSVGTYIQEGAAVGTIYPEETVGCYADIYVANSDIGKLKKGQKVKFEISAYPSSEYGYFTGKIVDIPKDLSVEKNSGSACYMVRVDCDTDKIQNKSGKTAKIMNGMACQARMIVEEKSVLRYMLEKIDLLD